jgi:hypothetical protein
MAPPAAANSPRPPMGVWVGALGKLGWAIINDEKTTTDKMINNVFILNPPINLCYKSVGAIGSKQTIKNLPAE